ncbi:hypothetical protein SteCoe_15393 [Stentor coeruleus]|uniref:Uncharacterized protein n=1 Tax=Stentor coeruleus TaxID=5963 RepID=A0A1R2C3N6_9CILI|nr:hypothetical protein SteCoe_15393 [Stentor coeruleus]
MESIKKSQKLNVSDIIRRIKDSDTQPKKSSDKVHHYLENYSRGFLNSSITNKSFNTGGSYMHGDTLKYKDSNFSFKRLFSSRKIPPKPIFIKDIGINANSAKLQVKTEKKIIKTSCILDKPEIIKQDNTSKHLSFNHEKEKFIDRSKSDSLKKKLFMRNALKKSTRISHSPKTKAESISPDLITMKKITVNDFKKKDTQGNKAISKHVILKKPNVKEKVLKNNQLVIEINASYILNDYDSTSRSRSSLVMPTI